MVNKNKKGRMEIPKSYKVDLREWVVLEIKRTFQNSKHVNLSGMFKNNKSICA